VWAGTGEGWAVRDMDMMGDGIYKSTDAGETWTNMGLPQSGRIGTVVIDPRNENVVLACVLGRATGPQQERGVYRTEDGGKTWAQALFVNRDTGCSGLSSRTRIRTSSSPARGRSSCRRTCSKAAAWAAASICRTTTARRPPPPPTPPPHPPPPPLTCRKRSFLPAYNTQLSILTNSPHSPTYNPPLHNSHIPPFYLHHSPLYHLLLLNSYSHL
jgi:hypothetical protein